MITAVPFGRSTAGANTVRVGSTMLEKLPCWSRSAPRPGFAPGTPSGHSGMVSTLPMAAAWPRPAVAASRAPASIRFIVSLLFSFICIGFPDMVKQRLIATLVLLAGVFAGCAAQERPLLNDAANDVDIVTSPAAGLAEAWTRGADGVIALAGKPSGFVATRASYTNYRLHVEWRWPGKPG